MESVQAHERLKYFFLDLLHMLDLHHIQPAYSFNL